MMAAKNPQVAGTVASAVNRAAGGAPSSAPVPQAPPKQNMVLMRVQQNKKTFGFLSGILYAFITGYFIPPVMLWQWPLLIILMYALWDNDLFGLTEDKAFWAKTWRVALVSWIIIGTVLSIPYAFIMSWVFSTFL